MIVDSSVLIHLSRAGRLNLLKEFGEIQITEEVYKETVEEQRGKIGASSIGEACGSWIKVSRPRGKGKRLAEQEGIEEADASLILLAEENNDVLLSNDYVLIKVARSRGVEAWWLTTLLLKVLERKALKKEEAKQLLLDLIGGGMRLSVEVYAAILKRIEESP